jgi:predicted SprT family Zn-dependent metalloprotease
MAKINVILNHKVREDKMVNKNTDKIGEANKEAKTILDYCIAKYNIKPIKIKVKNIRGGSAYYSSRFISIPIWAYNEGLNYFYAYVLHEVSHFINYDSQDYKRGHTEKFQKIEKTLLKDFGLIPVYNKVYIKALKNERGQIIYTKNW